MRKTLVTLIALFIGGISYITAQSLNGNWRAYLEAESDEDIPVNIFMTFTNNNKATLSMSFSQDLEEVGTFNCEISFQGQYNYNAPKFKLEFDSKTQKVDFNIQYNEAGKALLAADPSMEKTINDALREGIEDGLKEEGDELISVFNDKTYTVENLKQDSFDLIAKKKVHFVRVKTTK